MFSSSHLTSVGSGEEELTIAIKTEALRSDDERSSSGGPITAVALEICELKSTTVEIHWEASISFGAYPALHVQLYKRPPLS